jgi:hypothetical protein
MAVNRFGKPNATLEKRFAFGILLKQQTRFAGSGQPAAGSMPSLGARSTAQSIERQGLYR